MSSQDYDDDVRVILFPVSNSARNSAQREENSNNTSLIPSHNALPSPVSSEDESNLPPSSIKARTKFPKRRTESQIAIILRQRKGQEVFTFGTSKYNDVYLYTEDEECYVNLIHLELYPHPDKDAVVIYNTTPKIQFEVRCGLGSMVFLPPGDQATLGCGTWFLRLGVGLEFNAQIFPSRRSHVRKLQRILPTKDGVIQGKKPGLFAIPALSPAHSNSSLSPVGPPFEDAEINKNTLYTLNTKRQSPIEKRNRSKQTRIEELVDNSNIREVIASNKNTEVVSSTKNGKLIATKLCRGADVRCSARMWRNELDILRRLKHRSIVALVDYNAENYSLDLEYAGLDLARLIDSNDMFKLDESSQHCIWKDVSCGLQYVHAQKIIHLDIKPQNILFKDDRAVLCDFGLSSQSNTTTSSGGTAAYMPPEFLLTDPRGYPSDIWAFGVTMLFVQGLIPLPRVNWIIADVSKDPQAEATMRTWLAQISSLAKRLPHTSRLRSMLSSNPRERITASGLFQALKEEETLRVASAIAN